MAIKWKTGVKENEVNKPERRKNRNKGRTKK